MAEPAAPTERSAPTESSAPTEPSAPIVLVCDVSALAQPDLQAIDALARVTLVARRHGCGVGLRYAAPELLELLALAGLEAIVPCAESVVESRRQPEHREEPGGVEEERDPADPSVRGLDDL